MFGICDLKDFGSNFIFAKVILFLELTECTFYFEVDFSTFFKLVILSFSLLFLQSKLFLLFSYSMLFTDVDRLFGYTSFNLRCPIIIERRSIFAFIFRELLMLSSIFLHSVSNRKGINLNEDIAIFNYTFCIFFNLLEYIREHDLS